jgi:hypothetical protein
MDREDVVGNCPHDIRKPWHFPVKAGNDHFSVFPIFQLLSLFDLRLDSGSEIIVDGPHHIDLMVPDLIYVRQRVLVDRMDECDGKFVPL